MLMDLQDAMNKEEGENSAGVESGTARARRLLVGPMAGLARPRGVAAAVHADELDRLARKLSYMDGAGLSGLCDLVLHHAGAVALPKRDRKSVG